MTIKQHGGVFGRNPTFNNVTVDGTLTVDQIVEKTGAAGITLDSVTLKDGNVVLADGKGIDFSATAGTGTSELLDDYEEGTWTPIDVSGDGLAFVGSTGVYTKVGRMVMATGFVQYPVTASSTGTKIGGLPFININSTARGLGVINYKQTANADTILPEGNATTFFFATATGSVTTNAQLSNTVVYFGLVYTTT